MKLYPDNFYHIYNRGNNKQKIFFTKANYLYFLSKIRIHFSPFIDILCYCLMPNHFHFMVHTNSEYNHNNFSSNLKILLSSYSQAINNQEKRVGSLFQQNTKAKCLTDSYNRRQDNHALICFHYIHQNPLRAGLVDKMENWEFSSFKDYIGLKAGTMCNQLLAREIFNLPKDYKSLYKQSYEVIDKDKIRLIF